MLKIKNITSLLLLMWLFTSVLYYIDTLFTGDINLDSGEGLVHKLIKYVILSIFSVYFLCKARSIFLCIVAVYFILVSLFIIVFFPGSQIIVNIYIILLSLLFWIHFFDVTEISLQQKIPSLVIYSATLVGFFSIYEIFFLAHLYASYWAHTGGMRSISTMFNPNNLGIFMGVALIFLMSIKRSMPVTLICFVPIMFAFVMSGSRTAWVGVVLVCIYSAASSFKRSSSLKLFLLKNRNFSALFFIFTLLLLILSISLKGLSGEIELREVDTYTADIRWTHFVEYLDRLDVSFLLPDFEAKNVDLTSDNAYLILMNALGFLPLLILSTSFFINFRLNRRQDGFIDIWRIVFVYYIFCALADSTINSFPNNLFFTISVGAIFTYRGGRGAVY